MDFGPSLTSLLQHVDNGIQDENDAMTVSEDEVDIEEQEEIFIITETPYNKTALQIYSPHSNSMVLASSPLNHYQRLLSAVSVDNKTFGTWKARWTILPS
eukprot:gene13063-15363_t